MITNGGPMYVCLAVFFNRVAIVLLEQCHRSREQNVLSVLIRCALQSILGLSTKSRNRPTRRLNGYTLGILHRVSDRKTEYYLVLAKDDNIPFLSTIVALYIEQNIKFHVVVSYEYLPTFIIYIYAYAFYIQIVTSEGRKRQYKSN